MIVKVSDYIADLLTRHDVKHLWAISGAGDVHLFDSIAQHPDLVYVCPHHEQAGVMASLAYYRLWPAWRHDDHRRGQRHQRDYRCARCLG